MDNDFIARATFSEVNRFLKEKKESDISSFFKGLFGAALLFFPALMCRDVGIITDLATGATLAGAGVGAILSKAAKNTVSLFRQKERCSYADRYDRMQMAQVMLVYASYFDTISQYLPNENGEITLSCDVRRQISQDGFHAYLNKLKKSAQQNKSMPKLLEQEIALPDPARTFSQYKEELKKFYESLNNEFLKFFEELSFWKEIVSSNDRIDREQKEFFAKELQKLPERALCTYEQQYFELAVEFPEFAVWVNHGEHARIEAQIDIGFQEIAEELKRLNRRIEERGTKAAETLLHYQTKYAEYIKKAVIEDKENDFGEDILFPSKEEIFVPQAFQALTYRKSLQLENKEVWKDAFFGEDIGRYIRSVLQHPKYGEYPMLILGLPGAGKTLLCHMLAAQILSAEFYVIIIHLRDAIAENTIMKQIDAQIENDFGEDCKWSDLRRDISDKPFLLIFDGYDELLQASGKTHSDYLNKIVEFQTEQRAIYHKIVRCIVTSRETLIDKASIPARCPVLRLCDFDNKRIKAWSAIWNHANEKYFADHQIDRLKIASSGRVRELAGQPLLLTMLALYAINGNKLQEQRNISRAELYFKLIKDFIIREKKKNAAYRELPQKKQEKEVTGGFHYLGIAALGMYNRRQLFIRTADLNRDIHFLAKEISPAADVTGDVMERGEKLIGSFFFIHSSQSMEKKDGKEQPVEAYEFLHNTFGEFLTAYFILELVFSLIRRQLLEEDAEDEFIWTEKIKKEWHVSLAYTPLFTRPVVLQMIRELSEIMADEQRVEAEKVREATDSLVCREIGRLIKGTAYSEIDGTLNMQGNPLRHPELMLHVAAYSINLILLRLTVCSDSVDFTESLGKADDWRKLTQIWRYAFSEEELVSLSCLIGLERTKEQYRLVYRYDEEAVNHAASFSKLDKMYRIAGVLGEDAAYAVFGAYCHPMDQRVRYVIKEEGLQIETQYAVKEVMRHLLSVDTGTKELVYALLFLRMSCEREEDAAGLYLYCAIVRTAIGQKMLRKEDILQLEFASVFRTLDKTLRDVEHIGRWDYLNMIIPEIFKCVYVLPMREKFILLKDFTDYFRYEIRSLTNPTWQMEGIKDSVQNIIFSYCKMMQSVIKRGRKKEFGEIFHDFIRKAVYGEILFDVLYEGELAEIFWTCLALSRAGEKEHSMDIMRFLVREIPFERLEEITVSFFQAMVECFYSFAGDLAYMPELYYLNKQLSSSEKINAVRLLLPAREQTFYHLLCLVCSSSGKDAEMSSHFDWTEDVLWAVTEYGSRMSVRTLEKIEEYGELMQNRKLVLEIKKMVP